MRRLALASALMACASTALGAQSRDSPLAGRPFAVWLSASVGPGRASGSESLLLGGQFALWASVDRLAVGIRRGGASNIDNKDTYDTAVLVGLRARVDHATILGTLGPGVIGGTRFGDRVGSEVGLSAAVECALNARYVGAGVAGFAAIGRRTRFVGVGFTLELGKIQ